MGLELWSLVYIGVLMLVLDLFVDVGFWIGFGFGFWILILLQPGLRSGPAVNLVLGIVFVLALNVGILSLSHFCRMFGVESCGCRVSLDRVCGCEV
jgi:hypothetical protein